MFCKVISFHNFYKLTQQQQHKQKEKKNNEKCDLAYCDTLGSKSIILKGNQSFILISITQAFGRSISPLPSMFLKICELVVFMSVIGQAKKWVLFA